MRRILAALAGCAAALSAQDGARTAPADTGPLRAIRPIGSATLARADRPQFPSLEAYFHAANPDLIKQLAGLEKTLAAWDPARRLIFCDEDFAGDNPLPLLGAVRERRLALLVGPEGGFSEAEREMLRARPFVTAIPLGRCIQVDRHGARGAMTAGSLLPAALLVCWANVRSLLGLYVVWTLLGVAFGPVLYELAAGVRGHRHAVHRGRRPRSRCVRPSAALRPSCSSHSPR